ncbi:MAG: hypothetical protein IJC48_10255 [Clostridia bacterium]|nr:hypothetical protein [Clostridia bacterium]
MERKSGVLLIRGDGKKDDFIRIYQEAAGIYQYARKKYEHLTLLGIGTGAVYAVMLAERFSPDKLVLAPFIGSCADDFIALIGSMVRGMYMVLADVEMHIPESCPDKIYRRLKRFVKDMRSEEKRIIRYIGEQADKSFENMANGKDVIKMLA